MIPVFKTDGHSYIAFKSLEAVYGRPERVDDPQFTKYRNGLMWPDFPTDDPNSGRFREFGSFLRGYSGLAGTSSLVYRSHHGDLQFWHSMSPSSEMTNAQVLDKIVGQAREWWNSAASQGNIFHIGKLNHMVTDAFPVGHVLRDSNGDVVSFRTYDSINKEQGHSRQDIFDSSNINHQRALAAATTVLSFYKQGADFRIVEDYLRNVVYKFADGVGGNRSGGNIPVRPPELGGRRDKMI